MSEAVSTEVQADIMPDGTVRPRTFTLDGRTLDVIYTGRQWIEEHSRHVLVMTNARDTYELIVAMPEMRWWVVPIHQPKYV